MSRMRRGLLAGLVVVLFGVFGFVFRDNLRSAPPPAPPSPPPAPRPSELYASDGTTLIARFDLDDPRQNCLRLATEDWGLYCDYLVSWWSGHKLGSLPTAGYRITGSLDVPVQRAAQQRVAAAVPAAASKVFSVVTIEPGTGQIKAMAAGRTLRQVPAFTGLGTTGGATFMMFTLVAALDSGLPLNYTINTKRRYESKYVVDPASSVACDGHFWCPRNTGDPAYLSGERTMWDALGHAVVTYFVPLQERLGSDRVIALAQRTGLEFRNASDREFAKAPSSAHWGAFTIGVSQTSALDLANAYATLAAGGTHCDPLPVRQVADRDGRPVAAAGPACEAVLKPDVARAAMDAGRCPLGDRSAFGADRCGPVTSPAGKVRGLVGRPVSGQYGTDERKSSLALVVASPQLVTAGAVGPDPAGANRSAAMDSAIPAHAVDAVAQVQRAGLAALPSRDFTPPARSVALGG